MGPAAIEVEGRYRAVRLFLLGEGVSFAAAALIHFGVLGHGFEHRRAGIAESVIGIVLLTGLVLSWMLPKYARGIGLAVQGFALLGTLVGVTMIAVGIGPRTLPDITYHVVILMVLTCGLVTASQSRGIGGRLPE